MKPIYLILATILIMIPVSIQIYKNSTEQGIKNSENKPKKKIDPEIIKSAEQGDAKAQYALSLLYFKGEDIPKDYKESYKWSSLAAAQNNKMAIKFLDVLKKVMPAEQLAEAQLLSVK